MEWSVLISRGFWVGLMLLCGSVSDLRHKSLSKGYLIVCSLVGTLLFLRAFFENKEVPAFGIIPGIVMLLAGRIGEDCIGIADGVMLVILGLLYGLKPCIQMLLTALLFAGVFAIVLIVSRRADRKSRIPFYPFLLGAFLLYRCPVLR